MFELNGREQAILIWIGVLVMVFLLKHEVRNAFFGVVKAFLHPKIFVWVLGMIAVTGLAVAGLHGVRVGKSTLWEYSNLKTTIVWVLTFALVTMLDVNKIAGDRGSFRKLAVEAIAPTAWVVFVGTLYTFSVWIELVLVPVAVFLGLLLVVAEGDAKSAIVVKPLQQLILLLGAVMVGWSLYTIATDFDDFAKLDTFREFVVPIILTFAFLPYLILMTLVMAYESAFVSLSIRWPDSRTHRYAKARALLSFGLNKEMIRRFARSLHLRDSFDRTAIDGVIAELKVARARELNPPSVSFKDGWSPYAAGRLLAAQGLATRDYHQSFDLWFAESPSLKVGKSAFTDSLTYSIFGTELAATRLKLRLNANVPGTPTESDETFFAVAEALIAAVTDSEQATKLIAELRKSKKPKHSHGLTFELSKDNWGDAKFGGYERRLAIVHPANKAP